MSDPKRKRRAWCPLKDEDVAFAAAQYGSGISQREIAANFGYANSSTISVKIANFVEKYAGVVGWEAFYDRPAMLKIAVATFVTERVRREMEDTP